ncbi:exonuclease family protein [Aphelenchoides avenae]|nr:exonuclease family protein [Aphelenchus avenae]
MASAASFYDYVSPYILNESQLQINGYPLWSPYFPEGHVAMVKQNVHDVHKRPIVENGDPYRKCERCESFFDITQNVGVCVHHPKRAWRAPGSSLRRHLCCNAPFRSIGCITRPYHVTHQFTTAALTQFEKAPQPTYGLEPCSKSVYALDTEMVYTTAGAELARLTLVDANCAVVLDAKVRPSAPVIDCNTVHSGITYADLLQAPYTLATARQVLFQFINADTIIIGHSMENDLKALRMVHKKVVDTAVLFPHPKAGVKYSLKELAQNHLNVNIQQGASHCSAEDARTCMQLMRWLVPTNGFNQIY